MADHVNPDVDQPKVKAYQSLIYAAAYGPLNLLNMGNISKYTATSAYEVTSTHFHIYIFGTNALQAIKTGFFPCRSEFEVLSNRLVMKVALQLALEPDLQNVCQYVEILKTEIEKVGKNFPVDVRVLNPI